MLGLVTDFTTGVKDYVLGNPNNESFMQAVNAQYTKYKAEIWKTAPRFAPVCSSDKPSVDAEGKVVPEPKFAGIVNVADLKDGHEHPAGKHKTIMNLDEVRLHIKM